MIDRPVYLHVAGNLLLSDESPAKVHELCATARINLFMTVVRCYARALYLAVRIACLTDLLTMARQSDGTKWEGNSGAPLGRYCLYFALFRRPGAICAKAAGWESGYQKAAGIFALRLAGFANLVFLECTPARRGKI
jgi:hypothetical protein